MSSQQASGWDMEIAFPPAGSYTVIDLSQPLYTGIPHHPAHPPYSFTLTKKHGDVVYPNGVSGAAEMFTTSGHLGTHVDGFSHVARDGKVYGDHDILEKQTYGEGMSVHSVHELTPFLATAHLVDMPTLLGRELTTDDRVSDEHFETWFSGDRTRPQPGEVVLIRTGWDAKWGDPKSFLSTQDGAPGVDLSGARWLSARGVRAAGSDTIAFEKVPNHSLDVHVHLLVESGISIIEALNLAPAAERSAWRFFLSATPLHIVGGTGSPMRPLAFVAA